MVQSIIWVVGIVVLLALVPLGLKWLQRRVYGNSLLEAATSRVVSAIAVGPQQRVVTVEVGPAGNRTWLVLGVTAHSVNCLHAIPVESPSPNVSTLDAGISKVTA